MSANTLMVIVIILLALLIPLLLSYWIYPDKKKSIDNLTPPVKPQEAEPTSKKIKSFEALAEILGDKKSSKKELLEAIEQLVRHHGKIHAKLGDLPHPDYKRYLAVIMSLCSNPQADKGSILALDQKLRAKNPKYGLDIDDAVNKGIAKRGF